MRGWVSGCVVEGAAMWLMLLQQKTKGSIRRLHMSANFCKRGQQQELQNISSVDPGLAASSGIQKNKGPRHVSCLPAPLSQLDANAQALGATWLIFGTVLPVMPIRKKSLERC